MRRRREGGGSGVLLALVASGICPAISQSLIIPGLPAIEEGLDLSKTTASWLFTAFLISGSVTTPVIGRLGDMYGKDRLLVLSLLVLCGGSMLSGLAGTAEVMLAGRVAQGVGAAAVPLCFSIVRDELPRERVAHGLGVVSSLFAVGGAVAVIISGPIVDGLGYQWLFWTQALWAAVAMTLVVLLVPPSPVRTPGRINWLAAVLLSVGLAAVLLAVSQGGTWGWTSPKTLGALAVGVASLVLWVLREFRAAAPLIDMRLVRIRGVWTTNLATFLAGIGMYMSLFFVPQFVQEPEPVGFGASAAGAGLYLLPQLVAIIVAGQFSGVAERRLGSRVVLMLGAATVTSGMVLIALAHQYPWSILTGNALVGVGTQFMLGSMANLIVAFVRQDQTGVAQGMNAVTRTVGGAVGTAIGAAALAAHLASDGQATNTGYTLVFWVAAAAMIVSGLACGLIPRRPRRVQTVPGPGQARVQVR